MFFEELKQMSDALYFRINRQLINSLTSVVDLNGIGAMYPVECNLKSNKLSSRTQEHS